MTVTIIRPGQHVYAINGPQIITPRGGAVNWWEAGGASGCVLAHQPKGAASYAASKINLANPGTYDATEGIAPSWASGTGWTFTGTEWLKTSLTPAVDQTWTAIAQYTGMAEAGYNHVFFFYTTGSTRPMIGLGGYWSGDVVCYANDGSLTVAPALLSGNLCVAGNQGYRNGAADGGPIGLGEGLDTEGTITWAQRNVGGSLGRYTLVAGAIYNTVLTAPQVLAVSTAMAAL